MTRFITGAGLVALIAASSGCQRAGANPDMPLWMHRPSGSMQLEYTRSLMARSREVGEPYERGGAAIDVAHRRVFTGSRDNGMYAIQAQDGSAVWRFETLGPVQCEPFYDPAEDALYFGSNDGALYKVDASTGAMRWRFSTGAEVSRRVILEGGVVYVWNQHRPPALGMEVAGYAGPLVWRGLVYSAFSDGTVTAFDAHSGEERWAPVDLSSAAEQAIGEVPTYLDVDTTPVPGEIDDQPVVYVASYEGGVSALNADSGARVWSNTVARGASDLLLWEQPAHPSRTGGPDSPARQLLIVSTGTTGLWALDPESGDEVWHRDVPAGGTSRAAPILGALMFSTTRQGLYLLSPLDGRVIDGIHTGEGFSMAPTIYGKRAFIVSNAGRFYSIQVEPPI
jgi:outer membrane protein assembly factor BamB